MDDAMQIAVPIAPCNRHFIEASLFADDQMEKKC